MNKIKLFSLLIPCLLIFASSIAVSATTICVPDDYSTIQEAINAASSGDTVVVRDGTYTENVIVDKDHLTVRSENGARVTRTMEFTLGAPPITGFGLTILSPIVRTSF